MRMLSISLTAVFQAASNDDDDDSDQSWLVAVSYTHLTLPTRRTV